MTTRTGPLTKDTTTVALGLAQIRVALSSTYIGQIRPILTASHSIGALADTKFTGAAEYFKLESGYPLLEDATFPLRESASISCSFKEITPANIALSQGLDPSGYSENHAAALGFGNISTPVYLRMEAYYVYPDGTNSLTIIFPRCQVSANREIPFAPEDVAAVPIVIEAKRADSSLSSGGHVAWDDMPLGRFYWDDGAGTMTTTTTTTTTTA